MNGRKYIAHIINNWKTTRHYKTSNIIKSRYFNINLISNNGLSKKHRATSMFYFLIWNIKTSNRISVFINIIYCSYTTDGSTGITMIVKTSTLTSSTPRSISSQYKLIFIWYTKVCVLKIIKQYRICQL